MKNLFKTIPLYIVVFVALFAGCRKADFKAGDSQVKEESSASVKFFNKKEKEIAPKFEKGVVLFKLKSNSSLKRVAGKSTPERVLTKAMERSGDNGFYKVRIQNEEQAVSELKKNPDVQWASLNYTEVTQGIPDDPYWSDGSLWGMLHIGMPTVWASGNFGNKNVVVGVIDEGIFSHDDLCSNIWNNPFEQDNGIDDDGNGYIDDFHGWNWFDGNNQIYQGGDDHGTHVAGTIGGRGGNQIGVVGVNSNVTLISCKFLNGYGYDDNAVRAIDYLIDLKTRHGINIKVTSNSWGGGGYNPALIEAIDRAKAADILFVAAAGNADNNNDVNPSPSYPATYPNENIISVGASDWQNNKAFFSSYGQTTVDIFAPGTGIVSTLPSSTHTSTYGFYSGTSMATPHVSGACALYAGINPEANWQQIKNAILSAATKLPQLATYCRDGNFLNVSGFIGQTPELQDPIYPCPEISPDQNPPSIPQNFIIYEQGFDTTPGAFYGGYMAVRWDRSTDPEGSPVNYILWYDDIGQWSLGGNNYVIAGLDTTNPKIAWVQSYDDWGNQSAFSNRDTTGIWNINLQGDNQPPTLVGTPFTSNVTTSSITFHHSAANDNVGVTSYTINWRASGGSWLQRTSIHLDETFSNLSQGTTYEFYYTARDAAGNVSVPSQTISATTLTPPNCNITSGLNATSQALNVTLTWNVSVSGTCSIQSSKLERRKNNGSYTVVATNPVSPYQDQVATPGQYTYRITLLSTTGQTFYSNEKSIQVKKK